MVKIGAVKRQWARGGGVQRPVLRDKTGACSAAKTHCYSNELHIMLHVKKKKMVSSEKNSLQISDQM
jgi:hypothetical protein